jgi:hypothetical protein
MSFWSRGMGGVLVRLSMGHIPLVQWYGGHLGEAPPPKIPPVIFEQSPSAPMGYGIYPSAPTSMALSLGSASTPMILWHMWMLESLWTLISPCPSQLRFHRLKFQVLSHCRWSQLPFLQPWRRWFLLIQWSSPVQFSLLLWQQRLLFLPFILLLVLLPLPRHPFQPCCLFPWVWLLLFSPLLGGALRRLS